jgi:hypothetical protein
VTLAGIRPFPDRHDQVPATRVWFSIRLKHVLTIEARRLLFRAAAAGTL